MVLVLRRLENIVTRWAHALPVPPALRTLGTLVWRSTRAFNHHDGSHLVADLAYYIVFSIFPLALGAIALVGFFISSEEAQSRVFELLQAQLPGFDDDLALRGNIRGLVQARGVLGLIAVVGLLWSATTVFGSLERAVNRAWGVSTRRHYLVRALRQSMMVLVAGALLFLSLGLSALGQLVTRQAGESTIGSELLIAAWTSGLGVVPLLLAIGVFLLVYRLTPSVVVRWRDVVPGAVFAGLLFEASKLVFVWYLDNVAIYDQVYGSISIMIILLLWAYVASTIVVVGAELSHEYTEMRRNREFKLWGYWRPVKGGLGPPSAMI